MNIKEKLEEFDLFDNGIIRHGNLDYVRDYELIGYIGGEISNLVVRYLFKGCIEIHFKNTVEPKSFSMDDRLLNLDLQNEPDYPQAFVWAAGADAYPGWELEEDTDELIHLAKLYKMKFYKLLLETNAYKLTIIFHDLEIFPLEVYENQKIPR